MAKKRVITEDKTINLLGQLISINSLNGITIGMKCLIFIDGCFIVKRKVPGGNTIFLYKGNDFKKALNTLIGIETVM